MKLDYCPACNKKLTTGIGCNWCEYAKQLRFYYGGTIKKYSDLIDKKQRENEELEEKIQELKEQLLSLQQKGNSGEFGHKEDINVQHFSDQTIVDQLTGQVTGQEVNSIKTSHDLLNEEADKHEGEEGFILEETSSGGGGSNQRRYNDEDLELLRNNLLKDDVRNHSLENYTTVGEFEDLKEEVKSLKEQVKSLKEQLQPILENFTQGMQSSVSEPQTDISSTEEVDDREIKSAPPPSSDFDEEPDIILSKEEKNLVSFYESGQDLSQYIIPVSETEESQANRRGGDKNILFERDRRGSYWIVSLDNAGFNLALVPKSKLNINQHNIASAEVFFECRDFRQRAKMSFELLKPGKVSKSEDNQELWQLDERGILQFF